MALRWRHWGSLSLNPSHRQIDNIDQSYSKLVFLRWRPVRLPASRCHPSGNHQSRNGIDFLACFFMRSMTESLGQMFVDGETLDRYVEAGRSEVCLDR